LRRQTSGFDCQSSTSTLSTEDRFYYRLLWLAGVTRVTYTGVKQVPAPAGPVTAWARLCSRARVSGLNLRPAYTNLLRPTCLRPDLRPCRSQAMLIPGLINLRPDQPQARESQAKPQAMLISGHADLRPTSGQRYLRPALPQAMLITGLNLRPRSQARRLGGGGCCTRAGALCAAAGRHV
jgi:hypothetical protein